MNLHPLFFVSLSQIFVGEPFIMSLNSGIELFFLCDTVRSHFSVENFLSHSGEHFRRETLLCFRKDPVFEKITDKRGARNTIFRRNCSFLLPNCFVQEPFCVSECFELKNFMPNR